MGELVPQLSKVTAGLGSALHTAQTRAQPTQPEPVARESAARPGGWRSRKAVLVLLAVLLAWQVVTRSVASYLADAAPETALRLGLRQPAALVNLAEQKLRKSPAADASGARDSHESLKKSASAIADSSNLEHTFSGLDKRRRTANADQADVLSGPATEEDSSPASMRSKEAPDQIRSRAEAALIGDPLNAHALRILGELADGAKDDERAQGFMRAAARLSLHEVIAVYWLMQRSARARDFNSAIYYADAVLRARPELGKYVIPVLGQIAEERDSSALLKAALAADPPWRAQFFAAIPTSVRDARTPLDLLLALRARPAAPKWPEIGPYLDFLIGHQLYDIAYYTWLQFLPAEELRNAGLLFNGSFKSPPSGMPFDWVITQGSGVTIDIVPASEEGEAHALLVDFQFGRVEYHGVRQLVMLAPGTYEFKGRYSGELSGPRGLKWRIVCADGAASHLGVSSAIIGRHPAWKDVEFAFTVPAKDCGAQYVRLDLDSRMASEQIISGSVMFDGLQISRAAGQTTNEGRPRTDHGE